MGIHCCRLLRCHEIWTENMNLMLLYIIKFHSLDVSSLDDRKRGKEPPAKKEKINRKNKFVHSLFMIILPSSFFNFSHTKTKSDIFLILFVLLNQNWNGAVFFPRTHFHTMYCLAARGSRSQKCLQASFDLVNKFKFS